jgi:hypothetical protein
MILTRVSKTDQGVFGVLLDKGIPLCLTLERPWKNNERNVSCIPPGTYSVVPHSGAKFKNCFRLENVPGRAGILIHAGNRALVDSTGCILVGDSFDGPVILNSQKALQKLRDLNLKSFILTITEM